MYGSIPETPHVLQFRTVCKPWRRLLSDHIFIRDHHRLEPVALLLNNLFNNPCIDDDGTISALPFPYNDQSTAAPLHCGITCLQMCLHGCCDGLLLFSCSCFEPHKELDSKGERYMYYVCNPATRELAGLPADLSGFLGFYRHAPTGEYRVLCYPAQTQSHEYLVVAPGQHPARRLRPSNLCINTDIDYHSLSEAPVIHRGCLQWMLDLCSKGMVVFDTVSEEFRRMSGPVDGDARMDDAAGSLVEVDGTLGASLFVEHEGALKLWVLESYQEEAWAFRYNIDLNFLDPTSFYYVMVAHVSDEGDAVLMTSERSQGTVYNLRRGEVVSTSQSQERFIGYLPVTEHVYKESLVSLTPKGIGESSEKKTSVKTTSSGDDSSSA